MNYNPFKVHVVRHLDDMHYVRKLSLTGWKYLGKCSEYTNRFDWYRNKNLARRGFTADEAFRNRAEYYEENKKSKKTVEVIHKDHS